MADYFNHDDYESFLQATVEEIQENDSLRVKEVLFNRLGKVVFNQYLLEAKE